MLTRGHIIGKLIDDLSALQSQIEMRGQVGLFDLNKFCEDFIKEVLNVCYNYSLVNLNTERSNEPGLDLGDLKQKIAYQVTSTATSDKVNKTLLKVTDDQLKQYTTIRILILGKKQNSYHAIDSSLMTRCNFNVSNIIDFSDLGRQIVTLKYADLYTLHQQFQSEFQIVVSEFEIPNNNGDYKTSILDKLELMPSTVCVTGEKLISEYEYLTLEDIAKEFKNLGRLPRVTRDFLHGIIKVSHGDGDGNYEIGLDELRRRVRMPENEFHEELTILTRHHFIREIDPDDHPDVMVHTKFKEPLQHLIQYARKRGLLQKLLVVLDFTVLD